MAYQARGRDPLLDSNMAEAIEKRGKELLGLTLLALAAMATAMIVSYHPDDPSWMSAETRRHTMVRLYSNTIYGFLLKLLFIIFRFSSL